MPWATVMRAFFRSVAAMIVMSGVAGCTSISYYAQSLKGHVEIMAARQDVGELIDDPSTPGTLRARMASASAIRQFAIDELALPDNNSYRSYVNVGRDAVTWAIIAAPEFSLTPRTWCFPVFGCVPYRGYFSKRSAIETAVELQRQGLDVYVTGITAYSTLGWSSDPLLSTMLSQDETYLAGLVFHELAHQRVYVKDDSAFNEAFAVAVETTGVRKWLHAAGDTGELRRYKADRRRRAQFLALFVPRPLCGSSLAVGRTHPQNPKPLCATHTCQAGADLPIPFGARYDRGQTVSRIQAPAEPLPRHLGEGAPGTLPHYRTCASARWRRPRRAGS
jgi:predicted aminopeptidase